MMLQSVFAETQEDIRFASYIEELLASLHALEKNLDKQDGQLADRHSRQVYSAYNLIKPRLLDADAIFDLRVQTALSELPDRVAPPATRAEAQIAIDETASLAERVRATVAGASLSEDPYFKLQLAMQALQMSLKQYEDDAAGVYAQQKSSALAWRAGQLLAEIELDGYGRSLDAIREKHSALLGAYETRPDSADVATQIDDIRSDANIILEDAAERAAYFEEILAYLNGAVSSLDDGDVRLAGAYTEHATEELLDAVIYDLPDDAAGLASLLQTTFLDLRRMADTEASPPKIEAAIDKAAGEIVQARLLVIGETLSNDSHFSLMVTRELLERAAAEYSLAASDSDSLQKSFALAVHSERVFDTFRAKVDLDSADRIKAEYRNLRASYNAPDSDSLEHMSAIIAVIDGMVGVQEDLGSADYAVRTTVLLQNAGEQYQNGDAGAALHKIAVAYLNNYRLLTKDLDTAELGAEYQAIEHEMRTELRQMIRNGEFAPVVSAKTGLLEDRIINLAKEIIGSPTPQIAQQDKLPLAASLEEILGQIRSLEQSLDRGDADLAAAHAAHPIDSIYDSIKTTLHGADPGLDFMLHDALLRLKDAEALEIQDAIGHAMFVVSHIQYMTVREDLDNDPRFGLSVAKALIEKSAAKYEEAVSDRIIINARSFQDASSLVWRSELAFQNASSSISAVKSSSISEHYADLKASYDELADPVLVRERTQDLIAKIDEIIEPQEELELLDYVDNVRELLTDVKTEYRAGNADLALAYATRAYIDNYEFLEMPLAEAGEADLMLQIEHDMREELRSMIRDRAPPDEVDAHVDMLLEQMDAVAVVVPEFGAMAAAVFGAAVIAILLASRDAASLAFGTKREQHSTIMK